MSCAALKPICLASSFVLAAAPLSAEERWEYTFTGSAWFTGLSSDIETPFGDLNIDLDFSDIRDILDLALFSSFEARNGRFSLIADLVFADLGADQNSPFGGAFRSAEVDTRLTLVSAYGAYSVVDDPGLRIDLGGGLRYSNADLKLRLVGNMAPTFGRSLSETWVDPLVGARAQFDLSGDWYGNVFADIGGFGIGNASDLTWQAYAGVGYRFNETWSMQVGYRHLSIDRAFDRVDATLEVSGPIIGVQASF